MPVDDIIRETCGQSINGRQRLLIFKVKLLHILRKVVIHGDRNLPQFERIRLNVSEGELLLVLDRVLKSTDRFGIRYFNREDFPGVVMVAKDNAVKFKVTMTRVWRWTDHGQ